MEETQQPLATLIDGTWLRLLSVAGRPAGVLPGHIDAIVPASDVDEAHALYRSVNDTLLLAHLDLRSGEMRNREDFQPKEKTTKRPRTNTTVPLLNARLIAVTPNGKFVLACGGTDGNTVLLIENNGKTYGPYERYTQSVQQVCIDHDGVRFAVVTSEPLLVWYDRKSGASDRHAARGPIAFSRDGKFLCATTRDGDAPMLLDGQRGTVLARFRSPKLGLVSAMAFSRDGKTLFAMHHRGLVAWDTIRCSVRWKKNDLQVTTMTALPDETLRTVGNKVIDLDPTNGSVRGEWSLEQHHHAVAHASTGRVLLAQGHHWWLWNPERHSEESFSDGHAQPIALIAWSPDGRKVATIASNGGARLWDAATRELLWTLEGFTGTPKSLQFSHDGMCVCAVGAGALHTWDVASGMETSCPYALPERLHRVAISEDGTRAICCRTYPSTEIFLWNCIDKKRVQLPHQKDFPLVFTDNTRAVRYANALKLVTADAATGELLSESVLDYFAAVILGFDREGSSFIARRDAGSHADLRRGYRERAARIRTSLGGPLSAFHYAAGTIFVGRHDGTVAYIDAKSGVVLHDFSLAKEHDRLTAASVSPDGRTAWLGTSRGLLLIVELDKPGW